MSHRTSLRRQPDGLVKCYTCNGSGMNPKGVTMFEPCPECGGWGKTLPPKEVPVKRSKWKRRKR